MTNDLDLHAMKELPHGEAAKIIREKVDPLWGLGIDGPGLNEYHIYYEMETRITDYGSITVKAMSPEHALKVAKALVNSKEFDHSNDVTSRSGDEEYAVFF